MDMLFTGGSAEAESIIEYMSNTDETLQMKGFLHYCGKLTEYITAANMIKTKQTPTMTVLVDRLETLMAVLVCQFEETGKIDFQLFDFAYYVAVMYYEIKNGGLYDRFVQSKLQTYERGKVFSSEASIVAYAHKEYEKAVPYFGKYCVFGLKTFLDMFLIHDVFMIGNGLKCYPVHLGRFITSPLQFMDHDYIHEAVSRNVKREFGNELLLEVYQKILNDDNWRLLVLYLFIIIHEQSSFARGVLITDLSVFMNSYIKESTEQLLSYERSKKGDPHVFFKAHYLKHYNLDVDMLPKLTPEEIMEIDNVVIESYKYTAKNDILYRVGMYMHKEFVRVVTN